MPDIYSNLKKPQTLEEVRAVFSKQLDKNFRCDGEYLNGRTIEEAAIDYLDSIKQFPDVQITLKQACEIVEHNAREFKEHKGESCLYYMREVVFEPNSYHKTQVQASKIWESQLDNLIGVPYILTDESILPRFIQHNTT